MKKKRKYVIKRKIKILLLVLLLIIIGVIYFIYSHTIKLDKIDEYIYKYTISGEEEKYIPVTVIDNNIYYLKEEKGYFSLYKRSIYSKKDKLIDTVKESADYCTFEDEYIICSNVDDNHINNYYNYKMKVLYEEKVDNENAPFIIYYGDKFLSLKDNKLYDGDKLLKEFEFKDNDTYYFGDYYINNNTYITFFSPTKNKYIHYDVSNDKYVEYDKIFWTRYNKGFYEVKNNKVQTYNLITDTYQEYDIDIFDDNIRAYSLKDDMLYYVSNNKAYRIDLKNKTVDEIEHKFDKTITHSYYYNGYLYLEAHETNTNIEVYVIDFDKVKKSTYTFTDFNKYMDNLVDKKVLELEDKYHVNILYKEEAKIKNETFTTDVLNNNSSILFTLDTIDEVFSKFTTEVFDKFKDKGKNGLVIYLTKELIPVKGADTTNSPVGYALPREKDYGLVLDADAYGIKATVCHELMHNIEYAIDEYIYDEWFKKNPKNFEYMYTYIKDASNKYTTSEEDKNKVYFVDLYSKSYPTEDVARIFENICSKDEPTYLLEYPHLKEKAFLVKDFIEKNYPSMKDSSVFDSLKDNKTTK